jgi:hypothetical protein
VGSRLYLPITAILTFPSGSQPLYPGDCVPTPGGPVATARVVQKLGNDPPRFEIEFEACKPSARMVRDSNREAKPGTAATASRI